VFCQFATNEIQLSDPAFHQKILFETELVIFPDNDSKRNKTKLIENTVQFGTIFSGFKLSIKHTDNTTNKCDTITKMIIG